MMKAPTRELIMNLDHVLNKHACMARGLVVAKSFQCYYINFH